MLALDPSDNIVVVNVQIHHTFIINIIVNDDEFTWMCIFNHLLAGLSMVSVVSKFA